jgi:hypothetical protein
VEGYALETVMLLYEYCQILTVLSLVSACCFEHCPFEESEELLEVTVMWRLELVKPSVIRVEFRVVVNIIKPSALRINSLKYC